MASIKLRVGHRRPSGASGGRPRPVLQIPLPHKSVLHLVADRTIFGRRTLILIVTIPPLSPVSQGLWLHPYGRFYYVVENS